MSAEGELRVLAATGSSEVSRTFHMTVIGGPSAGIKCAIRGDFRIGTAAANDLTLADPTVSRFHCVIEWTPRGLKLRDLGSTNGTQVAGCFVESAYLEPLVPIQVGTSTLQIVSLRNTGGNPIVSGDVNHRRITTPAGAPVSLTSDNVSNFDSGVSFHDAKEKAAIRWERSYLRSLIRHAGGDLSQAARLAQMDPSHLRDLLHRYQLGG